jgi:hypothetical protein
MIEGRAAMQRPNSPSTIAPCRRDRQTRGRPLTAVQESLFFAVLFAVGLCLQLAALLLQASTPN